MRHTLFFLDYFHPFIGGSETLFDDIAHYCTQQGMQISVVTSRHHPSLATIEKIGDITIYRIGNSNRWSIVAASLMFAFRKRSLFSQIDHIHTSSSLVAFSARIIAKITKKPISITIHEVYDKLWYHLKGRKGRIYRWYENLVCHLAWSSIVTVSESSKKFLLECYPQLVHQTVQVFLNQLDSNFWSSDNVSPTAQKQLVQRYQLEGKTCILFVGRLGYEKGLPYLIEAFSQLDSPHEKKLIIIAPKTKKNYGKSTQHQITHIDKQLRDNYLYPHMVWIDPVQDIEELRTRMSICHIGVVPSMSEGFCYVGTQMQAMGMHMIASNVGALPEVLDKASTIFVPYGKVHALISALETTLKKDTTKRNFGLHTSRIGGIDYSNYYDLFQDFSLEQTEN